MALPAGNTPVGVSPAGTATVNISWTVVSGGAPVDGYQVRAFDAISGIARAVGGSCAGVVNGTTCADTGAPDGSWKYTVAARQQLWSGAQSPLSAAVSVDDTAPVVGTTVIAKTVGYLTGAIKQGGFFYVYANITDATGITSATADNSTLVASGGTLVPLVAGSYSVGGVSYNYRSASQTAKNPLTAGAYTYSVTATDVGGNSATQSSFPATVDNAPPTTFDIQTTNAGTAGKAEANDTIVFTYSEPIDPESILTTWTGASTNVVVRLIDGGCTLVLCSDDSFEIFNAANSARLPLTSSAGVNLNRIDYNGDGIGLGSDADITFASVMVRSGNTITITLGTVNGSPNTAGGNGTMVWTPSTTAYDAAANANTSATKTETGTADKDF